MTDWLVTIFWLVIIAVLTVAIAEMPKRWWLKPSKGWQAARTQRTKIMLMSPLLALLGALLGAAILPAAGIVTVPILALAAGGATGVVSFSIYDSLLKLLGLLPGAVIDRVRTLGGGAGTEPVEGPTAPVGDEEQG